MRIDRIKFVAELTRQDMTQKRLADLSGVSRATINNIKSGKSCSEEVANSIAKALGVPVSDIEEDNVKSKFY